METDRNTLRAGGLPHGQNGSGRLRLSRRTTPSCGPGHLRADFPATPVPTQMLRTGEPASGTSTMTIRLCPSEGDLTIHRSQSVAYECDHAFATITRGASNLALRRSDIAVMRTTAIKIRCPPRCAMSDVRSSTFTTGWVCASAAPRRLDGQCRFVFVQDRGRVRARLRRQVPSWFNHVSKL